jgi:hypothetical protein
MSPTRRLVAAFACLALAAVPTVAFAANPKPGGRYSGKSKVLLGTARHSVVIKISKDGKSGTIRYCGDRPRKSVTAGFKVSGGAFTASKRELRKGTRVETFRAKGTFKSRRRISGQIVVVFKCDSMPGKFTARLR